MINELIDQIGGRERLEEIRAFTHTNGIEHCNRQEWQIMARALLSVLDAQESLAGIGGQEKQAVLSLVRGKVRECERLCERFDVSGNSRDLEVWQAEYLKYDAILSALILTPPATRVSDVTFDPAKPGSEATVITQYSTPAGWKLVPVIPTWGMLSSDGCSKHHNGQECSHHENRKRIWSAMLAAAPAPGGNGG